MPRTPRAPRPPRLRALDVRVEHDTVRIGRHFAVSFQRTLRIPDDGGTYPLPPGLGRFPVRRVADYADRVPASWRAHGGVFIPLYQREALWLSFGAASWRPTAAKVAVGKVNAVSGEGWTETLSADPQDYVVCPDQPWLDGINAGDGTIRQFVAMPLGMGYTVEGQVTGREEFGGIQIMAVEPKPGRFPSRPPRVPRFGPGAGDAAIQCCAGMPAAPMGVEMGLGAGGRMTQDIHPDPHGVDTWDPSRTGRVYVHIVNSAAYREITGEAPPPTPVSARTYAEHGLPWFAPYDEGRGDVPASGVLAGVKSVKEWDAALGFAPQQDDATVEISPPAVVPLGGAASVTDGEW